MKLLHTYPTPMAFPAFSIGVVEPETPFEVDDELAKRLLTNPLVEEAPDDEDGEEDEPQKAEKAKAKSRPKAKKPVARKEPEPVRVEEPKANPWALPEVEQAREDDDHAVEPVATAEEE